MIKLLCCVSLAILISLTSLVLATAVSQTDRCAGVPGLPGQHGAPGRDGRDGAKGDKGETGSGEKGEKGDVGKIGQKGEAGLQGTQGIVGPKGNGGKVGPQGTMGPRGIRGVDGSKGSKGEQGGSVQVNWKQCVWNRGDEKNTGVIQECRFKKKAGISSLHVGYDGTLRVACGSYSDCCSRWYFTFNGVECSGPMTIEGLVYSNRKGDNVHRHGQIEGYCENIPAGQITVGFHIGKCARLRSTTYDGYTGWISTSRIVIEETSPPQQ